MAFKRLAYLALALVLLAASGCSVVTVGYNHADWILRYWINDYTSFTDQQREEIRRDIDDYLRWHRRHALPEYATFLRDLSARIDHDALSTEDVIHVTSEMSRLYRLTMAPSIRPAAHILSTLDSHQIEELRDTLAKKNRELKKELLSGSEQEILDKRADNHIRFIESLAGNLSSTQKEQVREMSLHLPFVTGDYLEQREAKQATLISLLNSHAGEEQIAASLSQWIDAPQASTSAQEQQTLEAYDNAMNKMIVRIFGLLTPNQKAHLHEKISGYLDDIQQLHSSTGIADEAYEPEEHRATKGLPQ
jgi:hypothetical protein